MKTARFTVLFFLLAVPAILAAQTPADSLKVVKTMKALLAICKSVDLNDPKTTSLGAFYKAAPYIIYHGDDKQRAWKEVCNYANADDKKGVDEACYIINQTIGLDANYRVVKYTTKKESEGLWHVLFVTYKKKAVQKKAIYAFLKIGDRFGLGDIDQ